MLSKSIPSYTKLYLFLIIGSKNNITNISKNNMSTKSAVTVVFSRKVWFVGL